jgi:hypothetical protein
VAFRAEHTGSAAGDRAQRQAQAAVVAHEQTKTYVAGLALQVPVSLMLSAAFTTTLATATDTKLSFPVLAGECWNVEYWGDGSCSSVNGMCYSIGAPANSSVDGWIETSSTNTLVANWLTIQVTAVNTLSAACHAGANNTGRHDRISARVKVGVAGRITLQAASITAATTTTIAAKSYLRALRVTEV